MELDTSALDSRRATGVPLCLSKAQKDAIAAANKSGNASSSPSHRVSHTAIAQTNGELPSDVDRALQMFRTYPVMRVQGTAFENYLNKADQRASASVSATNLSTYSPNSSIANKSATSHVLQDAVEASVSHLEAASLRRNSGEGMVRLATAVKRAAMWQTVIVAAMAGQRMSEEYRDMRLRKALERHMLPVLVKRREQTGSIMDAENVKVMTKRTQEQKKEAGSAPQGTYLKEHYPLFASFGNSQLLQLIADKMERVRYITGETIAVADEPSQHRLYVLVSGKCEVRAGTRSEKGTLSVDKSLIESGAMFGGIFGTSALHTGTYKAVSQCIVWQLARVDFEAVFRDFADVAMMNAFTAALRAQSEEWLQHRYPLRSSLLQRVPLYRRLPLPPSKYLPDFSPVVKIRGERLFDQDDNPGDVYVLMEGTVKRMTRGDDGTFATGTAQQLGPTSFTTFNASGRFLLLGEEPHVLPGFQRYRCVVQSRSALFYRVSGDNFVNALLDDPNALCELRGKLAQLYTHNMALDASCLNYAPILRNLSTPALQRLANDAKPSVVGRAVSVCEPAQTIKEIYLVTLGEVRDPRTYGHTATQRLPTPPPTEDDSTEDEESDQKGRHARKDKKPDRSAGANAAPAASAHAKPRPGAAAAAAAGGGGARGQEPHLAHSVGKDDEAGEGFSFDDAAAMEVLSSTALSTSMQTKPNGSVVAACVDEQDEFNPALPKRPAKRFLTTLGGGWEGLLTDKWPNGWATTTTTEVWAIPTLSIRTEYNNAGRTAQHAILTVARQTQKVEQGLSALPPAKLPPMSAYLPEQAAAKANLATAAAAVVAANSGRRQQKPGSRASGRRTGGGTGGLEESFSAQERNSTMAVTLPDIYSVNYVSQRGNSKDLSAQQLSQMSSGANPDPRTATAAKRVSKTGAAAGGGGVARKSKAPASRAAKPGGSVVPSAAGGKGQSKAGHPKATTTTATSAAPAGKATPLVVLNPKQAAAAAQVRAAAHRAKERDTGADGGSDADAGAPSTAVSAHLMAVYRGEFDDGDPALLNVVRDPVPAPARPQASSAPINSQRADAWPVSGAPGNARWFQEVPSYEPLPGTINNRGLGVPAPEFASNTAFMTTRHGKRYQTTLNGQEEYFSSTLPREDRPRPTVSSTPTQPRPVSQPQLQARLDVPKRHAVKDLM